MLSRFNKLEIYCVLGYLFTDKEELVSWRSVLSCKYACESMAVHRTGIYFVCAKQGVHITTGMSSKYFINFLSRMFPQWHTFSVLVAQFFYWQLATCSRRVELTIACC